MDCRKSRWAPRLINGLLIGVFWPPAIPKCKRHMAAVLNRCVHVMLETPGRVLARLIRIYGDLHSITKVSLVDRILRLRGYKNTGAPCPHTQVRTASPNLVCLSLLHTGS